MDKLEFIVKLNDTEYKFKYGVEAYIFHTGIYKDILIKYGMDTLLEYTKFVTQCYLHDDNRMPIGELADYIADFWNEVRDKNPCEVLIDFYGV